MRIIIVTRKEVFAIAGYERSDITTAIKLPELQERFSGLVQMN